MLISLFLDALLQGLMHSDLASFKAGCIEPHAIFCPHLETMVFHLLRTRRRASQVMVTAICR